MLPAARSFHNLSYFHQLLYTARKSLPNLIITLQTLATIALWECIHKYSLQDSDPQVKIVSLIIIKNGTTAAFQSCESKSLKWLQALQNYIVWRK